MELDFVTSDLLEEECVEFEEHYNEISDMDGERCGICMDLIIDRGVLDCCQHWFCFGCIDNWATITNLCPLCQSEFQFITCVPVYDTIGSGKTDDDSLSRDDEWYTEGKNNTQSFPSYYIDENAVICLDGNGCKIRSECISIEGDSNLDTSIACDSCDIWYHAFCVGFDPEGASEDTWLCPRCVANETPQLSDATKVERTIHQCGPENGNGECSAEAAFSRKVSVSVADTGETALVVSMVGENHWTNEPSEIIFSTLQGHTNMDPDSSNVDSQPAHTNNTHPNLEVQELELSLSCHTSSSLQSKPMVLDELKNSSADEAMDESSTSRNYSNLSEFLTQDQFSECDRKTGLDLGLSVGSLVYVNDANNDGAVEHVTRDVQRQNIAEESLIQANNIASSVNEDAARVIGSKRKRDCSDEAHMKADDAHMSAHDDETKAKNENGAFPKKVRADGKVKMKLKEQEKASIPTSSLKCRPKKLNQLKGDGSSDIMSVVKGTHHKPSKHQPHPNAIDKSLKEGENTGLRVKKIIRRDAGNKDSSGVVQELRKEIRDAVRNKSTGGIGENVFDPKLLAAFRAAVAGPKPDPPKKLSPMAVKTKKSLLQKGKVRENLTKKIYGDSNGRRKRAWDRDCEVEFWKYRCMRASKPEKIETLKSVLSLLRKNKEGSDLNPASGCQASNPILSRLYLADTSIFPRKDDIKPLSALKVTSSSEQKKELSLPEKSSDDHGTRITETNNGLPKAGEDGTGTNKNIPSGKVVAANRLHSHTQPQRHSLSSSADTKVSSRNEMVTKSEDAKKDRKKWAMEVLARKKALACNSSKHEKQEDNAVLKGSYPLLAQLPVDMRPVLAPSRHNKIPISVRQTQLYRLTELFLKQTNLEVLRRTAVTELAVADAINIEMAVANRSNSKLVYINLCSQEISRHSEKNNSISATESNSLPLSGVLTDGLEDTTDECLTDPTILEALKNTGLLDDSPPNSPQHKEDVSDGVDDSSTKRKEEEEPDNVFEMDPHYEVDIYGDFEYDIEDEEDYIGSSSVKVPKLQPEEGAQKMKVVFSTLIPETSSEHHQISDDHQILGNAEVLTDVPSLFTSHTDADVSHSTMENESDKAVPLESTLNEESEELSLAECEELYGPEKEPPINEHLGKLHGLDNSETATATEVLQSESAVQNENTGINQQDSSHKGKLSSQNQAGEKTQRKEKKLNTDTDKPGDGANSVSKKVEAYIKEHIRPLCKSGVITPEQYRWAVAKTTDKVMKYHSSSKNATFLIKEGEKVKKLAEQYLEASQQKEKSDPQ